MSFDGSFSVHSALERLVSRCPVLRPNPRIAFLLQKGGAITADDILGSVVVELFIHPSFSLQVIGCFRPLLQRIVEKTVEKLRMVPNLKSVLENEEFEEEIKEGEIDVIKFYFDRGRGLRIHELASLAFCRALDLAPSPFLLSRILDYFEFSSPPFERLVSVTSASQFAKKNLSLVLDATRVSYRFLLLEPGVFSKRWNWSFFLDMAELVADLDVGDAIPTPSSILDIRWCTIQILSVSLKISDRSIKCFGMGEDKAFSCLLRWEVFCRDTSLEESVWYVQTTNLENGNNMGKTGNFSQRIGSFDICSSSTAYDIELEKMIHKNNLSSDLKLSGSPFIVTSTVRKSFEMVKMAVSQKWPILLYGPPGGGKTALINNLAQISGNQVLLIHMDEQMDSKTLIGNYICSERPGEFMWQPGSLTQAVENGFWIVFEDIDKAPNEVQSIVLPLLEGSSSFVTGHGEVVNVTESFRLFATISTMKHDMWHATEGSFSCSVLWRKVMVGTASSGDSDILDIVNAWYPNLESISQKLVDTFNKVNLSVTSQLGEIQAGGIVSSGTASRFSLRDLLKWCKRITGLGLNFTGLSAFDHQKIYLEAVDIFVASLRSLANRLVIMRELANKCGVSAPEPEFFNPPSRPVIQRLGSDLQVGRIILQRVQTLIIHQRRPFVALHSALHALERVAGSVKYNEPVLLVGETGTGKTTLVQNLAVRLGQPLTVMNLSQQSDVGDLLGGFKPTDARSICIPLYHEFMELFRRTFSGRENKDRLSRCGIYVMEKKWKKLLKVCQHTVNSALECFDKTPGCGSNRKRPFSEVDRELWESFSLRLDTAHKQIGASGGMSFKFVEGAFITALRNGDWILLDEVNLAPPETLQRLIGVLDGEKGTLCLAERGDVDYVKRHPQFRLFACMNPATDAGKRELPYSFRSRFTEYFIDDVLEDEDLTLFVSQYLDDTNCGAEMPGRIVQFYKAAKRLSEERLQDGANQKPQFSLRSLARALEYTKQAEKNFGFKKSIYDGFCMFFLTLLDGPSAKIMNKMILSHLLGGVMPPNVSFHDYFIEKSELQDVSESDTFMKNYVITKSVNEHLKNLARAVYIKRYPVLLQGPTSSGKTSLVQYLAKLTGHEFVRINNHEHTDLQEYLGSYVTDSQGRLQFQEGVLVQAVRKGYWIVLDELNLAPSDVLESLNRLLDDNRELFVPELQETVSAHPDFMLFATQNPPMLYGGRKVLSRAFRNRFLEMHVDEIPEDELVTILEKRCSIPASYAMKMVEVMKELQLHRRNSKAFAGKHGFITPRDLFRWANRFRMFGKSYDDLAKDGYLLLAERLRDEYEKNVVLETLQCQLRAKLVVDDLNEAESCQSDAVFEFPKQPGVLESKKILWTKSMRRLYFLVERCYKLREPVLLVGETAGGKTTVCQLLSCILGAKLHILNCHQYTETSDFLGGFYPVRDRSGLAAEFKLYVELVKQSKLFVHFSGDAVVSSDISQASLTISHLNEVENIYKHDSVLHPDVTKEDLDAFTQMKLHLSQLQLRWQAIFLWQDGPLVQAMKNGDLFLVDEISLADDSVLERLNSVLEPERKLSLAEKGGSVLEKITAHPNFFVLATMNPGGDYGKKELSPALRNRFTEIWVTPVNDVNELRSIAVEKFKKPEMSHFADYMLKFWQWFNELQTGRILTVRDLLSWVSFMNVAEASLGSEYAFIHGAFLILLDGLSLGSGMSKSDAEKLREKSMSFLVEELKMSDVAFPDPHLSKMENYGWGDTIIVSDDTCCSTHSEHRFGIKPFFITRGGNQCTYGGFEFLAPTTRRNALRVLRAMQLPKPVLLEGSPGVGKTSLVVALAEYSGHTVVRINLSEQTDMMDLLGSDLPVECDNGVEFSWSDGILLQALKNGSWVLLDELNLAPQSVLEGLNAILDHRAEVFIPELNLKFECPPSFRVFACQNPSSQGGGRKGLPKSFLNRFTKVYVDELSANDYHFICQSRYPAIPTTLLSKLISFNNCLFEDTMIFRKYGQEGSPWEFNLRDVIRSCQIIEGAPEYAKLDSFLNIVYLQRMRTEADRKEVIKLYEAVFGVKPSITRSPQLQINPKYVTVGSACVGRNHFQPTKVVNSQLCMLPGMFHCLEAAVQCVRQQWLCILVGPYSSGKTSLVRLLAQLTGNALTQLNLSSGTEVSELLGCFEQYNSFSICRSAISQVERYVNEYFALRLELSWKDLIKERKSLFAKWLAFLAASNYNSSMSTSAFAESWKKGSCRSLSPLVEIIEQLENDLQKFNLPMSWSCKELNKTLNCILHLQQNQMMQPSAKFEWVPGDLIKAIECGEWVVLDNANLCNPTVLDRINSLVEPDGSITINERGLVDGMPLILKAHPKFRMFLTVDPKHGEVSRAMRNRGLEIYMMSTNWLSNIDTSYIVEDSETSDVRKFLVLSGIPFSNLVSAMSDAHMFTKTAGSHLGVRVTLLELSRWVQLFQQLLKNGNQPRWSLELSFEHTYLSSLGEVKGRDIVMHAELSYLCQTEWHKIEPIVGCSSLLQGGWPRPHSIRNFLFYSKEACIRQNCLYLESLGFQCANEAKACGNSTFTLNICTDFKLALVPTNIFHHLQFPSVPCEQNQSLKPPKIDLARANQMLFFAANWTIEQATESDIDLYRLWFKWFSGQLQPYCRFFDSFLKVLVEEREHPIWTCILDCARVIISHYKIDVDAQHLPLLSLKLVKLAGSDEYLTKYQKRLRNAIRCVSLLRITYQQWHAEDTYVYTEEIRPVLGTLKCLESEVLKVIVNSRKLFQIYSNLLGHHSLLWQSVTSSQLDHVSVIWSWLKKEATKLQSKFPEAVGALLVECLRFENSRSFPIFVEKPLLWAYGGHPFLPSSANIYHKMQQLLGLCDDIWPRVKRLTSDNHLDLNAVLSANSDLRQLAMQAVCMASYITTKGDQNGVDIVHQLEELYQKLKIRVEHEKGKFKLIFDPKAKSNTSVVACSNTACCTCYPEILCRQSGFDSWLVTLPLSDKKSLALDIKLLEELSKSILADPGELYQVLSNTSDLLHNVVDYSLKYSSRSPVDFSPHQTILWILDAWSSVDSVHAKIASSLLEMWLKWHSSIWGSCAHTVQKLSGRGYDGSCHLMHVTWTAILDQIHQDSITIKDYDVHCLKLRVASCNLWQDAPLKGNLIKNLLSTADILFKQIIFVHRKSFSEDAFQGIKSILCQHMKNGITQEDVQTLKSLISSSSHKILKSLVNPVIEALLETLYFKRQSCDSLNNLGLVWLHIGLLRFHLLLNSESPDPAMTYVFKHSQLLEKMSSVELEIKVRRECEHLAGRSATRDDEQERISSLQELEKKQKQMHSKVVFRPQPSKYKNMRSECTSFMNNVFSCMVLVKDLNCNIDLPASIDRARNWQETSAVFINRLSKEYAEYIDLVQPIQVAFYEMKLGLSMAVAGALEREYLKKIGEENMERVLATVYSLMQFPRGLPLGYFPDNIQPEFKSFDKNASKSIQVIDINMLKKLATIAYEINPDKTISPLQLQAMIHHILLIHVAFHVGSSLIMNKASFLLLNEIFDHFVSLWMDMKAQMKIKEEGKAQSYKFRPRSIKIEEILERDFSSLSVSDPDGSMTPECEEELIELEFSGMKQPAEEDENLEKEWDLIPELILRSLVLIHNQLFGLSDLVEQHGISQISDEDRLHTFMDSYKLGARIMKELQASPSSSLDDSLMPEHLLHICLEWRQDCGSTSLLPHAYNIYKDSNAPMMFKMIKPLTAVQKKATSLLEEWPDHPGLQKILDVTDALMELPLNTPLSKALLGLQLLLSRAQLLQENFPTFSFADQLQPLITLVSSWQKLELDGWPALLDGVQEQYDKNASKLWFPLHAVLNRCLSGDAEIDSMYTIQSIEEFIQTSSVGEFKKRLHLLLAFHGNITYRIGLQACSSPQMGELLSILYNAFGYYVQFVAIVLEHIESSRRNVEKDLKECLKLFNWEHSSVENFRRTRQKIWKLVKKFNDDLQQPVMVILNQDAVLKREKVPAWLEQESPDEMNLEASQFPLDLVQLCNTERFLWCDDWRKKANLALQSLCCESTSNVDFFQSKGIAEAIGKFLSSESSCGDFKMRWEDGWTSLEKICTNTADFAHIWKHGTKNLKKTRALGTLLKTLEKSGLSRHRSVVFELGLKSSQPSSSFLEPSYNVSHLLQAEFCPSLNNSNISASNSQKPSDNKCTSKWKSANQYYFKNLAMVQQLRHMCLNFSKDLSLQWVTQAASFVDHLLLIQQEQRCVAYGVFEQLHKLRQQYFMLNSIEMGGKCSVTPNQHAVLKCMWQQKHLFDSMLAMLKDMHLLLLRVKSSHMSTCNTVGDEAGMASALVDKFIPSILQSKKLLDKYLLGNDEAVTTSVIPFLASNQMEQLVMHNFEILRDLEEEVQATCVQNASTQSVKHLLLNRLRDLTIKGKMIMADFNSELEESGRSICEDHLFAELNAAFTATVDEINELMMDVFAKLYPIHSCSAIVGNITLWKDRFESYMGNFHLDRIFDALYKTIAAAIKLVDCAAPRKPDVCCQIDSFFKHLHISLDLLLTFGEGFLLEFLDAHKTIAEMTHVLANVFILLFSKGFGTAEDPTENAACDGSKDASGTGMGEGEGIKDVSDQIDDEAQLLGTSEEQDGLDKSDKVPNKDKGVEMEDDDFAADTFSVSEDSGDDEDKDEEDIDLESKMGETGDDKQVVDEKLWDNGEDDKDDKPDDTAEKYETGSSVKGTDVSDTELRAGQDNALAAEEEGEAGNDEPDKLDEDEHNISDEENGTNDENNPNDMIMDKNNAFEDPTGIQLSEQEPDFEDVNMDEPQGSDTMQETDSCPDGSDEEIKDEGDKSNATDHMDDENSVQMDDNTEMKGGDDDPNNANEDLESSKESFKSDNVESSEYPAEGADSIEPVTASQEVEASTAPEMRWSSSSDLNRGLAPSMSSPTDEIPKMELFMPDSSDGSRIAPDQPKSQASHDDTSAVPKTQTNPYRSIGDAMDEWKERAKVSVDPHEPQLEGPEDLNDEDAEEYRYVSELEKSTSQALGSAMSDQIKDNVEGNKSKADEDLTRKNESVDPMDVVKENVGARRHMTNHTSDPRPKVDEEMVDALATDNVSVEELEQNNLNSLSENLVSFKSSDINNKLLPLDTPMNDIDFSKPMDMEVSESTKTEAIVEWRRCEMLTTKLSQELAEQLRLVMEPTMASKLQGDYRTGKRINMKKVIPYIASHYRKDKIWLRRTKPNKRDYQVVVAVDDSRSMSESHCGSVAVEALVTVCRAMSQLEVGQFAVASFGEKGNIKLLHDFDEPFTGEAGVKMISSLSFKQDNTIRDEPVSELLNHLNHMLDAAVAKARMPSGQNPLHQLILIIADGRFHEKENLKRYVRDTLSRKRMVAFLLLDSPKESIMDLREASYEGGGLSFSKYLNTFPFPYYVILKNIEALPRALADLLRQWFELIQSMSE